MGYKILGYAVWNGAKWYVKQRYGGGGSSTRRYVALGVLAVGVGALVVKGTSHRNAS
ncbi:hypothetical protein [Conexibacter woesei]|uniref:hypothetical protein n=1 Tax=Conexibacter woesei TaxID=191495 RepID=UPI0003F6CA85|nr:hypothetical protein [Conexibacter woesei]